MSFLFEQRHGWHGKQCCTFQTAHPSVRMHYPSVSNSLVCNDWLAYKHQSTAPLFNFSPLTKHVWIVVLIVYKHRIHPGSVSWYKHVLPASLAKRVLIGVPFYVQAPVSTCVSNTFGLRFLDLVDASVPQPCVRTRLDCGSQPVCAHTSVFSLVQTCLAVVACLFTLPPAPK